MADGIDHSTSPDHVLVQLSYEGGFVPLEWTYTNFPFYSLYGDGTLSSPARRSSLSGARAPRDLQPAPR